MQENRCEIQTFERIDLVLTNGLKNIDTSGKCEIIISGMGGTLIAEILSVAENIRHEDIHLVLQPQSHALMYVNGCAKTVFKLNMKVFARMTGKSIMQFPLIIKMTTQKRMMSDIFISANLRISKTKGEIPYQQTAESYKQSNKRTYRKRQKSRRT